jgi:antitoxin component YwqK of YwqJK toxin-antitoxin module
MRLVIIILLSLSSSLILNAQDKVIVKYYDTLWKPVAKEKANFVSEFEKMDTIYKVKSYYLPSMKLFAKSTFADTSFIKGIGKMLRYYEDGKIKDSGWFYEDTKQNYSYAYTYYQNGNIEDSTYTKGDGTYAHYRFYANKKISGFTKFNTANNKIESAGYDENGKIIPKYVFEKPAQFPGGTMGWNNYLQQNLKSNTPVKKKAPVGKYAVIVTFIIDKEGRVSNVEAENDPGYGTKEEALRVIAKGPKWEPAIQYNQTVIYRHRQTITFVVSEEK